MDNTRTATATNQTQAAGPNGDPLDNLNADNVILILPPGEGRPAEIVHLTRAATPAQQNDLRNQLERHHFRPGHPGADTYLRLYGLSGTIEAQRVRDLLRERCAARPYPQLVEPTEDFNDPHHLDPLIEASINRLREEIGRRRLQNGRFVNREDPEDKDGCFAQPDEMERLTQTVEQFVTELDPQGSVDPDRAEGWVNGPDGNELRRKLERVAHFAREDNVIYHEPHHELTPGMILIDEMFRALVTDVHNRLRQLDPTALSDPTTALADFVQFVSGLEGASNDAEAAKYAPYILPSGDASCPDAADKEIHVDPCRIELFLEGTQIRATSVIVGAWKGGTHSAGHTT